MAPVEIRSDQECERVDRRDGSNQDIDRTGFGTVMNEFPRLALATSAQDAEPSVACLSMLAGLTARRMSRAALSHAGVPDRDRGRGPSDRFTGTSPGCVAHATGSLSRVVWRASRSAELSLVEGTLDEPNSINSYTSCDYPGELRPIAQALDLPMVAVVSCRAGATGSLHLPRMPEGIDAVLLDELTDPAALPELKRLFGLWRQAACDRRDRARAGSAGRSWKRPRGIAGYRMS